jgi:hypothetical protein
MAVAYISGMIALKLQMNSAISVRSLFENIQSSIYQYAPRRPKSALDSLRDDSIVLPVLDTKKFINQ